MQLRSALGERFEGSIAVTVDEDESLSTRCFRLVPGNGDGMQLLRAQLLYEDGQLYIQGSQTIDEPVLNVTVRLACPGREVGEFQRDYTLLLDPRGYAPVVAPRDSARPAARSVRRTLPELGGVWRSESGDSIEQIARRYFPRDEQERAWLIDELHGLNPDLPQNSRARLDPGVAVNLPSPRSRPATPQAGQVLAQDAAPVLRIEPLPTPRALSAAGLAPRSQGDSGEFHLRLSSPELNLDHQPSMTPEESLRLRENLLLLESDDQTAQLMQLKYQIAQMEKQLAQLKARPAQAETAAAGEPGSFDGMGSWIWAGLLALVLLPGGYAYWRWRERRDAEEFEAFSLATSLEPRFGPTTARPSTGLGDPVVAVMPRSGMHDLAHNIAQMANDWHNDEVDVVLPGNVSEEAQLLIDHGLVQQAVNLLSHEIEQHPTTLALWMKLFDVLRKNEMTQQFQERAVAFRLQFASDALWQQVQAQGRELDPGNPLYEVIDDTDTVAAPRMPEAKPASALSSLTAVTVAGPPSILEFHLDPLPAAEITTDAALPLLPDSEVEEVEAVTVDSGGEPLFSPADFMVATEVNQQGMERAEVDPAEFVSDDPVLKPVAELLIKGENNSVFRLLEETLYNGTLEQRQTALRWLDKLFPIKHR
ncbi:type IV pilus assembly protein FimV [Chitinolyticbacter albus]|uniref:type IV pilus assembly protein FimV n=1 Tax=Chitinolyticbacter albus TaxID=2961951 RepID=UPI002109C4EF|nr:hypothetical protein [Chitinolyticbacter albus]